MASKERAAAALRSPNNWALLGLIIERPSYAYELTQRFERTYNGLLDLVSASQIYRALDLLIRNGLIEEILSDAPDAGVRQPKVRYRATEQGLCVYREHLMDQISNDRRRSQVFARELAALAPDGALTVIDSCERLCLAQASETAVTDDCEAPSDSPAAVARRLALEDDRLTTEAKLPWIDFARREFKALLRNRNHVR
jgi:DNA-binding PadR family transcriptional regulator